MFKWLSFVWLIENVFTLYGGGKGGAKAPDYSAMAAASEKAAVLGKELGDAQLAENKRQYDLNMAIATPVVQAQTGLMNQTKVQGDDYFNYMKQYSRPVEQSLFYESMGFTPEEIAQIESSRGVETAAFNNAEMAKQQAAADVINNAPDTYTTTYQDNAIKGSNIVGLINAKPAVYGNNGYSYGGKGGANAPAVKGTAPNADAYYIKSADGSYTEVAGTQTKDERKVGVVGDPSTYGAAKTPETDRIVAQLSALASARMAAKDKTERDDIDAKSQELERRLGETNRQVYDRYAADIEAEAGAAVADSRAGFTNSINNAARQGLRYGFSPEKLAAMASSQSVQQAGMQAGAANQTRTRATEQMYGRGATSAQQGLTGITAKRGSRIQDEAIRTAKKLDTAGLYRNLPGASQGSYGLAVNAGNAAVGNQNATSAQMLGGMAAGTGTIMAGQQARISGLGNILNAQTSAYNASQGDDGTMGMLGSAAMAVGTAY